MMEFLLQGYGALLLLLLLVQLPTARAQVGLSRVLEIEHEKVLENRRAAFAELVDPFRKIERAVVIDERSGDLRGEDEWVENVVATIFWVGEAASENNPTANHKSAWDTRWQQNFGGYDDPVRRNGYAPAKFKPLLNPFYVALPYNDIRPGGGGHRDEAERVIPWFWEAYRGPGVSVTKGRWIEIRYQGKSAFGQWEDVGPFETDHWQYVFGYERPRQNRNNNAGIDLSPALRDYLGIEGGMAEVSWRFAVEEEVMDGPWSEWLESLPLPD